MSVAVVRTGVANLASVVAAFERLGQEVRFVDTAEEVVAAPRLVLPGVGSFGAAMEALGSLGVKEALCQRLSEGRATLAICLGLQLCCEGSEEAPGIPGLGVVPGRAVRLPDSVRVPQLGWNGLRTDAGCWLLEDGHVVYANSYALPAPPAGERIGDWAVARTEHGLELAGALERGGNQLLCQFHPELSGPLGARLLMRWLEAPLAPREATPGTRSAARTGGGAAC